MLQCHSVRGIQCFHVEVGRKYGPKISSWYIRVYLLMAIWQNTEKYFWLITYNNCWAVLVRFQLSLYSTVYSIQYNLAHPDFHGMSHCSAQGWMLKQGMCSHRHSLIKDLQRSCDQQGPSLGDRYSKSQKDVFWRVNTGHFCEWNFCQWMR